MLKLITLKLMKSKELGSCLPGAVLVEEVSNLNQTHSTFVDLDLVAGNGLSLLTGFVVSIRCQVFDKKKPATKVTILSMFVSTGDIC